MCKKSCPECAQPVTTGQRMTKTFCSPACKNQWHARSKARGQSAVPLLMAWRKTRGRGPTAKRAFQELCAAVDRMNAEDKAVGRQSAEDFVARQYRLQARAS